jgi:uncharacterized protein YndB with AHSA1/START domain
MAINQVRSSLSPDEVFDHLLNPWEYPQWLLGASRMRGVDDDWPAVGSKFHHVVGWGPLKVADHSRIDEIDRPRKLVLYVKATPLVQGKVTFTLDEVDGGTLLTLKEEPAIAAANVLRPALDPPTHARNKKSLQQLADLMRRGDGATAA